MPVFIRDAPRGPHEPDQPRPVEMIPGRAIEPLPVVEAPDYSGLDLAASAFRQGNIVSSTYDRLANYPLERPDPVPGYDVAEDLEGYEQYWRRFLDSESPTETRYIKDRIDAELRDREVIQQAGWKGMLSVLAAGAIDPGTILSIALPVAAPELLGTKAALAAGAAVKLSRAQRVWAGVAAQAALDTSSEVLFHNTKELRTLNDSLFNVGTGALLTGALGAVATRASKEELQQVINSFEARTPRVPAAPGSAGAMLAADVLPPGTNLMDAEAVAKTALEMEGVARGGQLLAKTVGKISPLTRLIQSTDVGVRRLAQQLADVPYLLKKNLKGFATPDSVESVVKKEIGTLRLQGRRLIDKAYAEYRAAGGTLSRGKFKEEISAAATRSGRSDIPQASEVAQWWHRLTADHAKRIRENPGFEKFAEGEPVGAESYLNRIYDIEKMLSDSVRFKQALFDHFKANPKIPKEGQVADIGKKGEEGFISGADRIKAARRKGVSDATINLEIAQRDAEEAARAYASARKALAEAKHTATGKGGLRETASKARRSAQAKRREAGKLQRQLKVLEKRMTALQESVEPRPESAIEEALTAARAQRKTVRPQIAATKELGKKASASARKLATKVRSLEKSAKRLAAKVDELMAGDASRDAFRKAERLSERAAKTQAAADAARQDLVATRAQIDELRAQLQKLHETDDQLGETIYDLTVERAIGRSRATALDTVGNRRGQILNRATEAQDEVLSAEQAAKRLREEAKAARKLMRSLKRPVKVARKAKTKAARIARKAEPPIREDAEIWQAVEDSFNRILGNDIPFSPRDMASSGAPLKERVLDVPDEVLAPWMERDFETLLDRYLTKTVPEIELRKRFGSINLQAERDAIRDRFAVLIRAAGDDAAKVKKLNDQMVKHLEDVTTIVNRLLGRNGSTSQRQWVKHMIGAARVVRTYNYMRLLGSQTVSSMSDYGRLISRHGLPKTMEATARWLASSNFRRLTRETADRIGTALEMVVDTRSLEMADIANELPRSRFQHALQGVSNQFSRVTLMAPWNSTIKQLSTVLEQDALVRKLAKSKLSEFEIAQLRRGHLDDAAIASVRNMIAKHADDTDGLWRLRTDLWEDRAAADLVEDHIRQVADEMVITRGVGDLPGLMDSEVAKTIFQFKSFAMASVNRTLIPMAQGLAMGDAKTAQGLASMLGIGALVYHLKELAAGREPSDDPARIAAEALNWSGLMGVFPDLWDPLSGLHEDLPRFSRYQSRSPAEALIGPTFGTVTNLFGTAHDVLDGDIEAKDIHQLRRVLPFQNVFYLTRMFNAIEGEVSEGVGAEGATTMTFGERVAETRPSKEARK